VSHARQMWQGKCAGTGELRDKRLGAPAVRAAGGIRDCDKRGIKVRQLADGGGQRRLSSGGPGRQKLNRDEASTADVLADRRPSATISTWTDASVGVLLSRAGEDCAACLPGRRSIVV